MFLEKESYERAGLTGQPHGVKGKRGLKPRWSMLKNLKKSYTAYAASADKIIVVQYDLRAPASFPGKKGYDRLLYACKNVFNQPITWLFHRRSSSELPFVF